MDEDERTLLDDFLGEQFNKISHENLSLFAFIWTAYIARIGTGGKVGNFYVFNISNGWFDVDLKVSIKKVMSAGQMEEFQEIFGWDIKKAVKEFQDAGIINEEVNLE